jgi:glycosyltransferase involved in cell wall biosynthesis
MKLVYIANARIPTEKAHGIQIMKMCEALAQCDANNANKANKIEVELVVPRRFNPIKIDPFEYYDAERVFKIKRLPCLDLVYFGLEKFGFLIQTITFLISAKIYLFFKRYDILYTREQLTGLFFNNYVLELHSLPKKLNWFYKKIWKKAKSFIALASFIKNELVDAGFDRNNILVSPNGVDFEKFDLKIKKEDARKKIGFPLDKKIVLYAGSFYLHDWKGIDILLNADKFLNDEYLLVLLGGSKEEIELIKINYKLSNILLIEKRSHREIPVYLKSADVLVLPNKKGNYISEKYTSPLKLFEYMASGAPIIASDLPSIREILNENNAVLVEPNNAEKLAEGIKKVLLNKDLADKISKQAFKDIQEYTYQKRAEKILEFIKNAND